MPGRIAIPKNGSRSGAAQRRTEFDLIRIQRAQAIMAQTSQEDPPAMAATNRAVHEAIWLASHNGTLVDLLTRLSNHLTRYPATTLSVVGRWQDALAEHDEIVTAIADRDTERAATLARDHMTKARDLRLSIYRQELAD
jgi:DNA-binding FadR family transcriptional regulator